MKRIRYLDARDARRRELAALPGGPEMVGKLEALLFERDPGGVNYEVNLDEYRPEAEKVPLRLPSARGVSDIVTILREEFMSFGVGRSPTWSDQMLPPLAAEVWELWHEVTAN